MTQQRHSGMPRWALAALAGAICAGLLFALLRLGLGFDTGLAVFLAGAPGLCIGLVVAGQLTAAGVVMGVVEMAVSAAVAVATIIVAVLGAFA